MTRKALVVIASAKRQAEQVGTWNGTIAEAVLRQMFRDGLSEAEAAEVMSVITIVNASQALAELRKLGWALRAPTKRTEKAAVAKDALAAALAELDAELASATTPNAKTA